MAGDKSGISERRFYKRVSNLEDALRRMTDAGLDGLEVHYPYGSEARGGGADKHIARFAELAARFGLFATGGSDYHGERKYNRLGEAGLEWEQWERLRDENGWQRSSS